MITNETINRAIDYMLQHVEEGITLKEVAAHCHYSPYYFSRLFKAQTGESVYGWIKRVRLQFIQLQFGFSPALPDLTSFFPKKELPGSDETPVFSS